MLIYFEFEEKRRKANVNWHKNGRDAVVHITDLELAKDLPTDLNYEIEDDNKIVFTIEDRDNKRLLELQNVLKRRLQELVR
jgi:5'-deoxynucleotidase YfbR-like HD superfamily hydrolase